MKPLVVMLLYVQGRTHRFVELRDVLFQNRRRVTTFGLNLRFTHRDAASLANQMAVMSSRTLDVVAMCWDGDRESAELIAEFLSYPRQSKFKPAFLLFALETSDLLPYPLKVPADAPSIIDEHERLSVA